MSSIPPFIRLNGHTRRDRVEMTEAIKDAIRAGGGWNEDFSLFSNISICVIFTVGAPRLAGLWQALQETKLALDSQSEALLESVRGLVDEAEGADEAEITGTLQVTFIHDEPDMRRLVPHIPG